MPFTKLHDYYPDLAERGTRSITLLDDSAYGLPAGEYAFLEMYCDDKGCDCRRVFFYVVSSKHKKSLAVIAWGWESTAFYSQWMRDPDPQMVAQLKGPILNPGSPQSEHAPNLLRLVREVLLQDVVFIERIKRHYALFREKVEGPRIKILPRTRNRNLKKKKRRSKRASSR